MAIAAFKIASLSALGIVLLASSFSSSSAQEQQTSSQSSYDLTLEGKEYTIRYNITKGELINMIVDESLLDVSVIVRTMGDGFFEITFPRQFMTQVFNTASEYSPYYGIAVFVDTIPLDPQVVADCQAATFRFPIEAGTEGIDFLGTSIPANLPPSPEPERYMFLHEATATNGANYRIRVVTNVESCDISLVESEKKLHIELEGAIDKPGYLKLILAHDVLGGNYTVLIDDNETIDYNATYVQYGSAEYYIPEVSGDATILSIRYEASENPKSLDIVGMSVIPEFSVLHLPVLVSLMITVVFLIFIGNLHISRFPPP